MTDEILHRTPGFAGWQQERWLHHGAEAADFLGPVGATLDKGGSPTAYLFRCRVCSVYLAYSDFT